jgi:hypothetical protein
MNMKKLNIPERLKNYLNEQLEKNDGEIKMSKHDIS